MAALEKDSAEHLRYWRKKIGMRNVHTENEPAEKVRKQDVSKPNNDFDTIEVENPGQGESKIVPSQENAKLQDKKGGSTVECNSISAETKNNDFGESIKKPQEITLQKPDSLESNKVRVLHAIGQGAFGKVLCVQDLNTGEISAIKIVKNVKYRPMELNILRTIKRLNGHHYHCATLLDSYYTKSVRIFQFPLYGSTLFNFLKYESPDGLAIPEVYKIIKQICTGVNFLHENNIVHGDLKLDNILFTNSETVTMLNKVKDHDYERGLDYTRMVNPKIVIIDFGQAFLKIDGTENFGKVCCTSFRPPEAHFEMAVSYPIDVWCVGLVAFALYSGEYLFLKGTKVEMLAQMEKVLGKFPERLMQEETGGIYFSNGCVIIPDDFDNDKLLSAHNLEHYKKSTTDNANKLFNLLKRLLQIDPQDRITMKEVMKDENWC